uniref:Uncharacterized protein n=1 Tax=Ditylenchus dipsaci TaxID=166011 RepID=A0A915D5L4_9BILA
MAEQEATGMDLSMQIKSVEERIVALLSVQIPVYHQTQTTSKPPAKSKWRKNLLKQSKILHSLPHPSKPFNAPPRQQEIAAIIQMDPNNMTSLTPQQLAQLLPGHLTTGANGQPVTVYWTTVQLPKPKQWTTHKCASNHPPPPPVILPSPAELGKKIEERRIRRKENEHYGERNELETKMRSILSEMLWAKMLTTRTLLLLHLDCEYERRTLTKEKKDWLLMIHVTSFVPDPYFLQSTAKPCSKPRKSQIPSTSSIQAAEMPKFQALQQLWTLTTMTLTLKTISTEFSTWFCLHHPKPFSSTSSEDEEEILPIQDPELQTSSQRKENKDSVDPPAEMASPLQENDPHISETHYMKSPELFTNFNSNVQSQNRKSGKMARNIGPRKWHFRNFYIPELVVRAQFSVPLPPKLRLTRARRKADSNGSNVGTSLKMMTVLRNDAGTERKFEHGDFKKRWSG